MIALSLGVVIGLAAGLVIGLVIGARHFAPMVVVRKKSLHDGL